MTEKMKNYLLNTVEIEDERLTDGVVFDNVIQKMLHVALNELGRGLAQGKTKKDIVYDWLMGLGCNIAYTYYDISNILIEHGHDTELAKDGDYQEQHYWRLIADIVVSE